jgi:hypothetical protein
MNVRAPQIRRLVLCQEACADTILDYFLQM